MAQMSHYQEESKAVTEMFDSHFHCILLLYAALSPLVSAWVGNGSLPAWAPTFQD